jgi:uncharacterized membrane protein YqgA involved in biofilm formation
MPGLGTLVNVITVFIGGTIGTLAGGRVSERMHDSVIKAMGLGTLAIGFSSSLGGLAKLGSHPGLLGSYGILVFAGSLLAGTMIGEAARLEFWLEQLGVVLSNLTEKLPLSKNRKTDSADPAEETQRRFVEGFMSASLIFCVGALTIVGSIQDGLGNPNMTFLKALLDGVMSLFLASTFGVGVVLSALSVFVVQGAIALLSFCVGAVIPDIAIVGIEAVGGALVAGVGWNFLLPNKRLPLGNMLPALFLAFALCWMLG